MSAVHTIPRELRALNEYTPDAPRLDGIDVPVLLLVGSQTERTHYVHLLLKDLLELRRKHAH